MKKRIAIIGGGAAGVFCAIQLAEKSNAEIHLFEKTNELLKKVKISGGGRCNVTHQFISNAQFSKNYPRGQKVLKQNFEHFSALDMKNWLENHGVRLKTESDGRMFPTTDDSQTIIDCFLSILKQKKVTIHFHAEISQIHLNNGNFEFQSDQSSLLFNYVIIATGGAQKERDLDMFRRLSIQTISPVPSLFTFKIQEKNLTELMGIAIPKVHIKILQTNFKEIGPVLITHWGLSGPAILKLSAWGAFFLHEKNYQFQISVNWSGDKNEAEITEEIHSLVQNHSSAKTSNQKLGYFPSRFWEYLLLKSEIPLDKKWSEVSKKQKNKLAQLITNSIYETNGKTTYKEEFVTAGGIDIEDIHTTSMESKKIANLYFIGEITNIDGITGGFNFQNAWTSAYICAQDILSK